MDISARFPQFMQNKWVGRYHYIRRKENRLPNISEMSMFYAELASDFACPTFGEGYWTSSRNANNKIFAGATGGMICDLPCEISDSPAFCGGTNMHNNVIMCRYCKIPNHFVWKCRKFAALSVEERIKFVDVERLCNGCLKPGHVLEDCWRKVQCDVNGRK